jgi:phospholipase C
MRRAGGSFAWGFVMRRTIALAGFGTLLAMIAGSGSVAADSSRTDLKNYQHVFVIMMENTGYNALIGNPNAPWVNAAASTYGLATSYFGVVHPSQPNYVAATAGIQGNDSDDDETLSVPNIVDQLESHGKTWRAYMQSLSLCGANKLAHACGDQLYERKHNSFVSFADVQSSPARMANVVDLSQLSTDIAAGTVPDYVWISPDQCNDMHGRSTAGACNFGNVQGLISTGDTFLSNTVGAIMNSSAWTGNSAIFIAWDESDFTAPGAGDFGFGDTSGCCDSIVNHGGGHVVTLVISHSNHSAVTSNVSYNHYSLLRTIQDGWRLGCLGFTCDTAKVPAMSALTGPKG